MRVVHVGPYADRLHRSPEALLEAWPALLDGALAAREAGVDVTVVQAAAHDATLERDGVPFRFVAVPGTRRGAGTLARAVRDLAPDIVHLRGVRFPLHVRALRRALPDVPILAQHHADAVPGLLRSRLESPLLRGLDAIACTNAVQAAPLLGSGVLPPTITVLEAPASTTRFTPGDRQDARADLGIHGDPCVAWVGRLADVKDPITALRAVRRAIPHLPGLRLWCAFTEAPLMEAIRAELDAHPELDARTTLLGALDRRDVERLLRGTDLFLSASRSESTGFALIEAMACGATPVATDIPAHRTLTGNGQVGYLFAPGDVAAGGRALIAAATTPQSRAAIRTHFDRHASPAAIGRALRAGYAGLLERRRNGSWRRVCLIVPGGVDRSGAYRVIPCILDLIERLADAVHLEVLALRQTERAESYRLRGALVHCVPARSRSAGVRWIVRQHRQARWDVLHALWMHPQGTTAALAGAALRVPVLLHLNGGDLARLRDIGFGARATITGRARLRLAVAGADRITAPSAAVVRKAAELGIEAERLTPGVATDRWPRRRPRPRAPDETLRLVTIGSLNRVKDHATLLHAIAMLRTRGTDLRLDCFGEDTLGGEVQKQAARLGLDRVVHFHGFVPHARLRGLVERGHALVVSSRHEADPIAALEAAVAGLAVVGTAVGHLIEWAPEAALTCDPGDASGMAALLETLAQDDGLRLRLAAAAQRQALHHDADSAAQRTLDIYRELRHARR